MRSSQASRLWDYTVREIQGYHNLISKKWNIQMDRFDRFAKYRTEKSKSEAETKRKAEEKRAEQAIRRSKKSLREIFWIISYCSFDLKML